MKKQKIVINFFKKSQKFDIEKKMKESIQITI